MALALAWAQRTRAHTEGCSDGLVYETRGHSTLIVVMLGIPLLMIAFGAGFVGGRTWARIERSKPTNDKQTQSSTTYKRDYAQPRLASLGEKDHGVWAW